MKLNFKHIDYLLIFTFSLFTSISFLINSTPLFFVLGFCVCAYFFYKINKAPTNVLSLFFLVYHPITLTLGQTGIPFLGAFAIVVLYVLVFIRLIKNSKILRNSTCTLTKDNIYLFILFILMIIKWCMSNFSEDGFQHIYQFLFFGIIPYVSINFMRIDNDVINDNIELSQKIYTSYLISFIILFLCSSNFIEKMNSIENPIGISFFFISNGLLSFKYYSSNKLLVLINFGLSLFFVIVLGQRAFLLALILCSVVVFFKSRLSKFNKLLILCLLVIIAFKVVDALPEDLGYKFNYLTEFINNFSSYVASIKYYGDTINNEIGTIGTRLYLWYVAIMETNFIFGKPLGSFITLTGYSYPHNIILEFYYLFGIVGLLGILYFIYKSISLALNKKSDRLKIQYFSFNILVLIIILNFSSSISGSFINLLIYYKLLNIHFKYPYENNSNY